MGFPRKRRLPVRHRLAILARQASSCFVAKMAPPRQRKNPRNGNAENRREDLVRAAAQLFREKSFEGTTIRDIAGAVGLVLREAPP